MSKVGKSRKNPNYRPHLMLSCVQPFTFRHAVSSSALRSQRVTGAFSRIKTFEVDDFTYVGNIQPERKKKNRNDLTRIECNKLKHA